MSELYHYGIKGQRWGIRRYQNDDGSLTSAGKERYGKELNKIARKTMRSDKGNTDKVFHKTYKAVSKSKIIKKFNASSKEYKDLQKAYANKKAKDAIDVNLEVRKQLKSEGYDISKLRADHVGTKEWAETITRGYEIAGQLGDSKAKALSDYKEASKKYESKVNQLLNELAVDSFNVSINNKNAVAYDLKNKSIRQVTVSELISLEMLRAAKGI